MALIEKQLDITINKVEMAINRLKSFSPIEGYHLAHSGGKDSVVIEALAQLAGVKHECHYNLTSVDPPELVRFVQSKKNIIIDKPRYDDGRQISMWNLIPLKKMPPTRLVRYCCQVFKESNGTGKIIVTGVRRAESSARKNNQGEITLADKKAPKLLKGNQNANFLLTARGGVILNLDNHENRRVVENCYRTVKTLINPIIDWTDEDVWEFIKAERIPYCELYDCGYTRLGCIGCPMNPAAAADDLEKYPKYKAGYIRAFQKMIDINPNANRGSWKTGEDVLRWWLQVSPRKDNILENQISMWNFMDISSDEFYRMYF